ncbi:MAG: diacylglycerol kinase family lipid kinase [Streptococcaceae bacterium]|jgi:YegS/Rv2252/BmrU family lipid kinase|nr:diacylglycerol kinase family lipid kinase [Streptococcaceae bacterium]
MVYYLLANPNSGNHRGHEKVLKLINYFESTGIQFRLFETSGPGQEEKLVNEILSLKSVEDQLIVLGGDGTLSLSMKYLPADLPFSYIPAGSGNDFARSLSISLDPVEAFKSIAKQKKTEIYVLGYDSEHFHGFAVNNIGIGLDGAIINAANSNGTKSLFNKLHLGSVTYIFTTLGILFRKKGFKVELDHSQTFENAFLFTMTKHPYFGGGVKIAPDASNLNNLIELVEVDKIPQHQFFGLLAKVLKASHLSDPRVHSLRQTEFTVKTFSEEPIQIDGEPYHIPAGEVLHVWSEKRTIIK